MPPTYPDQTINTKTGGTKAGTSLGPWLDGPPTPTHSPTTFEAFLAAYNGTPLNVREIFTHRFGRPPNTTSEANETRKSMIRATAKGRAIEVSGSPKSWRPAKAAS